MADKAKSDKARRKNRHPNNNLESTLGPAFEAPQGPRRSNSNNDSMSRQRNARGSRNNGGSSGPGQEVAFWDETSKNINELCASINADNANLEEIKALDAKLAEQAISGEMDDADMKKMEDLNRKGVKNTDTILAMLKQAYELAQVVKAAVDANEKSAEAVVSEGKGGRGRAAAARESKGKDKEDDGGNPYDIDNADTASVPSPMGSSSRKYGERASREKEREREAKERGSIPPKAGSVEPAGSERSATSSAAKAKSSAVATTFKAGDSVAFRPPNPEGPADWILGEVSAIVLEGKVRRYKVIDVDPDPEASERPEYKLTAKNMIRIGTASESGGSGKKGGAGGGGGGKTWDKGQTVLALYPQTTTFYKAEVDGMDESGENVELKFEGDDQDLVQKVERRFVIDFKQ